MLIIQLLTEIPEWAVELGLDETTYQLLELIVAQPGDIELILEDVENDVSKNIKLALEFARSEGLV